MTEVRALIAAAGRGTRAGLPYPKTLFPIKGMPILIIILELIAPYDVHPTVVVSPDGDVPIRACLELFVFFLHVVVQAEANGMGDAVLRFLESPAFANAEHVLLIWGDVPFIQANTLAGVLSAHHEQSYDFTFATRMVDAAYTVVSRDATGRVARVIETREVGGGQLHAGERDIGLFAFRKSLVLDMLLEDLPGKWGETTGAHGFLYIIEHLVARGHRVAALPIATELDLVSLNSMKDIDAFL